MAATDGLPLSDGTKVDVVEKDRAETEAKDAAVSDDVVKADIKSDTEVPARPRAVHASAHESETASASADR